MRIPTRWTGFALLSLVILAAAPAGAAVWRVPVDVPSISAALGSAASGDTIQLVGNGGSTYPERLIIDKDVTIEGGWRADFAFRDPSLYVSVVRDTTGLNERSIVRVDGSPTVVFDGVWFIGGRLGVEATDGADLTFRECLFRSQRNDKVGFGDQPGGALHMTGGSLVMDRVTIRNIITVFPGGGIGLDAVDSAVLQDCLIEQTNTRPTVQGVRDPAPGGAIWARDVPDLRLTGVTLSQCAAQFHWGGALYAEGCHVTAVACSVYQAFAGAGGGGMQFEDCPSVVLNDVAVEESFGTTGGALRVERVPALDLTNCRFQNNRASQEGGGIWMDSSGFAIRTSLLSSNNLSPSTVPVRGGGIWALNSTGTLESTVISDEAASGAGGALFQIGGDISVSGCQFLRNNSGFVGGGTHIELAGVQRLNNSLFQGNSAKFGGAVSGSFTGQIEMDHCTVTENSGQSQGAALYLDTSAIATLTNSILCCAPAGDLIYCTSASATLSYCNVWNEDAVNIRNEYGGICPDVTGTNGNIKANPQFCGAVTGDYTLSGTSPSAGAASDGSNQGWAGTGCRAPLSLQRESWGQVKSRYRSR